MRADIPNTIGRYEILGLLGEGGMGVVYRGRDLTIDRPVAIKVLGVDKQSLRDRFVQEAKSSGRLQHPNIVTIYEYGEHLGAPYIAMEFVDGVTLAQIIAARGRLDAPTALHYMRQVASALEYAHGRGVIHRDIKPANIMIATDALKILDFGIARMGDSTLTHSGTTIGTPNYMSPEQVCGRPVDRRCDIFAVGLVFYELLSGVQAFPGKAMHAVMHAVVNETPVSLSTILPELDPNIVALIERAIEKDPDRRFPTLAEMILELDGLEGAGRTRLTGPARGITDPTGGRARQEVLARKRAEAIEQHLQHAMRLFADRKFAESIQACEEAALFDTSEPRVLALLERARAEIDLQQAEWLAGARAYVEEEDTEHATELVDRVLALNPNSIEARSIQQTISDLRRLRDPEKAVSPTMVRVDRPADESADTVDLSDASPEQALSVTDPQLRAEPLTLQGRETPELRAGRSWLLVPSDVRAERQLLFKPSPPRPVAAPAVFRDVTPRAGDRDWFGNDARRVSTKATNGASVGISLVIHLVAGAGVVAVLTNEAVVKITDPPKRIVALVPDVRPQEAIAPPPVQQRPPRPTTQKTPEPPPAAPLPVPKPIPALGNETPPPTPEPRPKAPDLTIQVTTPTPPQTPTTNAVTLAPPPPPPSAINETPVNDYDVAPQPIIQKRVQGLPEGASGIVTVRAIVTSEGKLTKVVVITDTPYRQQVLAAANECTFRPAVRRGRPVAVEVTLQFNLATR